MRHIALSRCTALPPYKSVLICEVSWSQWFSEVSQEFPSSRHTTQCGMAWQGNVKCCEPSFTTLKLFGAQFYCVTLLLRAMQTPVALGHKSSYNHLMFQWKRILQVAKLGVAPHSRHFAIGSKNLNAYHFFLFRLYLDLAESESGRVQGMPKEQTQAPQTATIEAPVHGDHSQTCPRTHGE